MVAGRKGAITVKGVINITEAVVGLETTKQRATDTGQIVSCPHCQTDCRLLLSKNGFFLFLCRQCGLQAFARGTGSNPWFASLLKEKG